MSISLVYTLIAMAYLYVMSSWLRPIVVKAAADFQWTSFKIELVTLLITAIFPIFFVVVVIVAVKGALGNKNKE